MNPFEKLALELKRLLTGYREESYYRPLCEFLEVYGNDKEYLHMLNIVATSNPNSESVAEGAGFPDIELRQNRRLIGYIEVKPPTQNLDNPSFAIQFNRYKEAFENIVFTNFKKWILYTWDKEGKPQKTAEAEWDLETDLSAETLKKLLTVFFEGSSYEARTPHQLALALARKTKLLRNQVENAVTEESPNEKLLSLKKTFEGTLIQDISDHQFANIYAETIAYALFLAKLEHFEKRSNVDFTLRTAVDFLPKNVPIFKDLYQLTGGTIEPITPEIYKATEILIEQLNYADIERIYKKLVEHKPGEDPVIQFYEPFLAEYDPKEREARGVYYTPKPVVDYIVRSVDYILKDKFKKPKGLGDESVQILDPATGTGTFLMSVIQNIYADIEKKNKPLGYDLVKRKFDEVVSNHILKHLYGFELLVAPYAIAHLKLTLELERLGFNFSMTEKDSDKDNDRLKIFLANTLDDPNQPPQNLFGFESITEESEKARIVKKDTPILVIVGNPPYSVSSSNKSPWIEQLMNIYKEGVRAERNIQPLSDDYIKFLRFAQWKIEQIGVGVIAMITNHSYLNGLIHRGMREQLLKTFDQIFILDLHGTSSIGDVNPSGEIDKNVFNIQQGVSISLFVKNPKLASKEVLHADLWGSREEKFDYLSLNDASTTKWRRLEPQSTTNFFFVPKVFKDELEYQSDYYSIKNMYLLGSAGVKTSNDEKLVGMTNNFDLDVPYSYRPFDTRFLKFDKNLIDRPRLPLSSNCLEKNLVFSCSRNSKLSKWSNTLVSNTLIDLKFCEYSRGCYFFPLYIYEHSASQISLLGVGGGVRSRANLSPEFIKKFSRKSGLGFVESGQGDLEKTFGPEDVFYYAYAILHSPTFRSRYAEQLKIDFPRLPLTSSKELFKKFIQKGNALVNLHLLGENPFDKSGTIFDDTSKWYVKIGGEKPEDLDDWKVIEVRYDQKTKRIYVNPRQYFEGIEKEVWEFMIGGYQVLDKWLKDRKKAGRVLSSDDQIHYLKIVVALRETIRIMKGIDKAIPEWPIK